ncbi:MAG: hypothetical protein LRS49_05735 [Desulfurococcales archaeon]|nr:hypothetical protein [Desulfurococcales archaeon]
MARGGVLAKYKRLAEALGVRVLDVYRVEGKDGVRDIVRLLDYASGKVVLADLGGPRETLPFRAFVEKVLEALRKGEVQVNERVAARVLEEASKLDEALAAASQEAAG